MADGEMLIRELDERLAALARLEEGWDSLGAAKPAEIALRLARGVGRHLIEAGYVPTAVPGPDGSVQLGWHAGGRDVEINIFVGEVDDARG